MPSLDQRGKTKLYFRRDETDNLSEQSLSSHQTELWVTASPQVPLVGLRGLNYYAGAGQENATVIIQAGDKVLKRSISLSNPVGGDGNSSPQYQVGSVVVTRDQRGELHFSIR